ncbi:MAG TPA: family 20 glycosylhydrolase [Opitutaceae bacterium]
MAPPARPMILAFQWDLGRQVERLGWLLRQLPRYADWGYTELYLHLEDAVEYPSLPGVARPGAYSRRQMDRLVAAAARHGIGVVPVVNLLGHTQYLIKVPSLRDLNELRAPDGSPLAQGQVCPLHPRMLEVADALLRDVEAYCTAGKVHVGLDESFSLGRHPLSRAEVAEAGLAAHFGRYAGRLQRLAAARLLRMGIWADMLALIPGAISHLPPGIIAYDWFYYPFGRLPRMELHGFREYDLAPALAARGIEYWGCPMNGSFRHEPMPVFGERLGNIRSWRDRCRAVGAGGMLVTSWEPNRLAMAMTTVVDAAAASLWRDPGEPDAPSLLALGFARVFGTPRSRSAELARAALACDSRHFSGYARWEVNDRWDISGGRGGIARLEAESRFYARLAGAAPPLPAPFRASVRFRLYLARRDVFVRASAAAVLALRRRLARSGPAGPRLRADLATLASRASQFADVIAEGRTAARAVWAFSRDRRQKGPNELIVASDARRLAALRRWLGRAGRDPRLVASASPVQGAWQLTFDVLLSEPALQRVIVEREEAPGVWTKAAQRTAIEFLSEAARPRAMIRREFSVGVPGPGCFRIAVRGVGRVGIGRPGLSDGVSFLSPVGWRPAERRTIGLPALGSGFPDLDWTQDAGAVMLKFGQKKRRP